MKKKIVIPLIAAFTLVIGIIAILLPRRATIYGNYSMGDILYISPFNSSTAGVHTKGNGRYNCNDTER